jgi:hypothetical protein
MGGSTGREAAAGMSVREISLHVCPALPRRHRRPSELKIMRSTGPPPCSGARCGLATKRLIAEQAKEQLLLISGSAFRSARSCGANLLQHPASCTTSAVRRPRGLSISPIVRSGKQR